MAAHVRLVYKQFLHFLDSKDQDALRMKHAQKAHFNQNISIHVYMDTFSGYERSNPALIFGFLKIGI